MSGYRDLLVAGLAADLPHYAFAEAPPDGTWLRTVQEDLRHSARFTCGWERLSCSHTT